MIHVVIAILAVLWLMLGLWLATRDARTVAINPDKFYAWLSAYVILSALLGVMTLGN